MISRQWVNRRTNVSSRFSEERNDGKLSRSVLESSGEGDLFTDFNSERGLTNNGEVGLNVDVATRGRFSSLELI